MIPFAIAGALRPGLLLTWADQDGDPVDLSGATLSGKIIDMQTGQIRPIAGALAVVNGPAGQFTWNFAAGDVAKAGRHMVQLMADYPSGLTPAKTVITDWEVKGTL